MARLLEEETLAGNVTKHRAHLLSSPPPSLGLLKRHSWALSHVRVADT